jgi:hypothetical protein
MVVAVIVGSAVAEHEATLSQFDFHLDHHELYESGAMLLTALTYPYELESEESFRFFLAMCSRALWLKFAENTADWSPITVKPQYVFLNTAEVDKAFELAEKRLQQRLVAGRMALPFFIRTIDGHLELPPEIKRLSLNQMAEFVQDEAGQADASNVEQRIWRPSRPVIHFAAAAFSVGRNAERANRAISTASFLIDRAFLLEVFTAAEALAGLIEDDPTFPVDVQTLIRLPMR